ncbi:MAG: NAD(P)/FAD-dependent oxidoreductase [Halobacteriovoraceae bacterium]|nr:NAD(P)/FAD-dependent oxidoreductase [Halobacteriovoraceae bacterium]
MIQKFDAIIIGAGMSGLATAIRLSMYNKKVCLLEKHSIPGGLNSYYTRGKRSLDVGLHALTNFSPKGSKGVPLIKLLKQLRIPYEEFKLCEQNYSLIKYPHHELRFSNDFELLRNEVFQTFPTQIDGFNKLVLYIKDFNETSLNNKFFMAREVILSFINDPKLVDMILCPLLIYGSAWENDMDFSQFVIMFKSIFLEGLSKPEGGVRTIINILMEKLNQSSCEIRFKSEVSKIIEKDGKVIGIETKDGQILESECIFSSAGLPETLGLINKNKINNQDIGNLSFTESIVFCENQPREFGQEATIVFYNENESYLYRKPNQFIDTKSAVVCFPNNFKGENHTKEGIMRVTNIANYSKWMNLQKNDYNLQKQRVFENSLETCKKVVPGYNGHFNFSDVFTPKTITKYTSHFNGTVYGSTKKTRNGKTDTRGLYIIGTDQGFLGIVGSILSGISMANLYGLMEN